MSGPVRAQGSRWRKRLATFSSDDILAVHSRIRLAVLQHEHVVAARLQSAVKRYQLQACHGRESQHVRVCPDLWRATRHSRARAELLLDILRLGHENNSIISPDPVPQAPGFRHRFCVHSHDLFGCEKPKNSDLREPTEKELLLSGLLKPGSGSLGMYMPAPQERQPDIGIKEIQRVHRSAHSSGLPVVLWKQSEEIRLALASAAVPARPHVSHREEPVHESNNQFPPPAPLISGKGVPECPPWSESILAS